MKILTFFCSFILFGFYAALYAHAQTFADYRPMVVIPGLDPDNQSTDEYVNALYVLSITIAAFLAVVKIIFGGVKWMLSDVVTDKSSAKKDIWGAIIGLLIVLAAVLVLNTINPNLTKLKFLGNAEPISITTASPTSDSEIGDSCITPSACSADEVFLAKNATECGSCVPKEIGDDPTAQNLVFDYNTVRPDDNGKYRLQIATWEKLDIARVQMTFEDSCIAHSFFGLVTHGVDPENPEYYQYSCERN